MKVVIPTRSITSNEIFIMKQSIKDAHRKVLTLEYGMGYFAYMASKKDGVDLR